jgi:Na+/H+ antiporter NhaD/arsenite permease-like protein
LRLIFKGNVKRPVEEIENGSIAPIKSKHRQAVFFTGVGVLLMVPIFKTLTHLPPFMGMLIGLGIMWIVTEIIHSEKDEEDRRTYTVAHALRKIDSPSILFFLGILLAVTALESIGELRIIAGWMEDNLKDQNVIVMSLGLLSAIVDNVPLVAATQGMYDLNVFPTDHYLWEFLAYCTGTGGSVLIIGSAAGVAAMGLEKVNFFWYIKKIGWIALLGYFAGAVVYILQHRIFGL